MCRSFFHAYQAEVPFASVAVFLAHKSRPVIFDFQMDYAMRAIQRHFDIVCSRVFDAIRQRFGRDAEQVELDVGG